MMLRLGLQVDGMAEARRGKCPASQVVGMSSLSLKSAPRGVRRPVGLTVEYAGPLRNSAPWGYWAGTGGFAACDSVESA
jgi:hypothetical protein